MPHQCVRCGKIYEDGSRKIVKGCDCGGRFFFFIKKEKLVEKEKQLDLTPKERKQIETDVMDILGDKLEDDQPVILDIENIKIKKPGKYELDLVELFKGKPLIYRLEDGKYVIDIPSVFEEN